MAESSGYKEYLAGLLAGVATVATGHPFDTVKVKLQKHNTEAGGLKYRNGLHCTTTILKTEGDPEFLEQEWLWLGFSFRSKDYIGEQHHLLLEWPLRVHLYLAFILKQNRDYREAYSLIDHNPK